MKYEIFETAFKDRANKKILTSVDFVIRAALKALKAKSNMPKDDIFVALLQKHFSPKGNSKLKWQALEQAAKHVTFWYQNIDHVTKFKYNFREIFENDEEFKEFHRLIKNIKYYKLGRKYVYYFTAQDMTPEQQGVQAGHALFKLGTKLGKDVNPDSIYFQWVGVKDSQELEEVYRKHYRKYASVVFYEPDLGNRLTAVAYHPILWNKREDFLDYPLLTH